MISIKKHQKNTQSYTFIEQIGLGAYGQVFKATHNATETTVAIKYIILN